VSLCFGVTLSSVGPGCLLRAGNAEEKQQPERLCCHAAGTAGVAAGGCLALAPRCLALPLRVVFHSSSLNVLC